MANMEWKQIEEFPAYEVNADGDIRNMSTKKVKSIIQGCLRLFSNNKIAIVHPHVLRQKYFPNEEDNKWRPIEQMPTYEVSQSGEVRNSKTNKFLKTFDDGKGYLQAFLYDEQGKRHSFKVHRLVAEAFIPNEQKYRCVDHINRNRDDNRVENLRWADDRMNCWNRTKNNKYRCVGFSKVANRYQLALTYNGKPVHLGFYDTPEEAARAYNAKAQELGLSCFNQVDD